MVQQSQAIRSITDMEIDQVNGGAIFLIPIAVAFGKGLMVGTGVAGFGLVLADAAGLIEL